MHWLQKALDSFQAPAVDRWTAGTVMISLHADAKSWPEAFQTVCKVVSLIPLYISRFLETSDKQRLLKNIVSIASDAAAIALNAAKLPLDAIQLLKIGREVIAGSLNDMHTDISELQRKHPQLAEEYINLRDQLETSKTLTQHEVGQRIVARQKSEKSIQTIRALPGFSQFVLAPSEDELMAAAKYGPIVVINVSQYRCDALIIEDGQFRSLELPRLQLGNIRDRMMENPETPGILEWLWEVIARLVLDILGFTQPPFDGCWPRIWWIPTGLLSKFPLHAAGRHTNGIAEILLDRVI